MRTAWCRYRHIFFYGLLLVGCDAIDDSNGIVGNPPKDGDGVNGAIINNQNDGNNDTPTDVDSDGDGLTATAEAACGSDPKLTDTDSDLISDHAECTVYKTNPTKADSDNDGDKDYYELFVQNPPTDPLNPDNDGDGVASGPAGGQTPDCQPYNPNVFPGNMGPDGLGDVVNGIDIDCKIDVPSASFTFQKGYTVDAELTADGTGVFIDAYLKQITSPTTLIGCDDQYDHHDSDDNNECQISSLTGCLNDNCVAADEAQPYSNNHACGSWTETSSTKFSFDTCSSASAIGKGYLVIKIDAKRYDVKLVGRHQYNSTPYWATKTLHLGE